MQMPKCPSYRTCKYFKDQFTIVHFKANHIFSGFVNKPHSVNRNVSCARRQTHTQIFFTSHKSFHFMFHTCDLVHMLSMELVPCKLFNMLTIFEIFLQNVWDGKRKQASDKYVRSTIYLVPLINIRCQWGHWPCIPIFIYHLWAFYWQI